MTEERRGKTFGRAGCAAAEDGDVTFFSMRIEEEVAIFQMRQCSRMAINIR